MARPVVRTADSFGMSPPAPESPRGSSSAPHPPLLLLLKRTGLTVPCGGCCVLPVSVPKHTRSCGIVGWFFMSSLTGPFSSWGSQRLLISSPPSQNMMTGLLGLSCHPRSGDSLPKEIFRLFPSDSSDSSSKHFWNHLIPQSPSECSWCKQGCDLDHIKSFKMLSRHHPLLLITREGSLLGPDFKDETEFLCNVFASLRW